MPLHGVIIMNHREFPRIDLSATGRRLAYLMRTKGLCVKDFQDYLYFSAPQAIYKWFRGEGLPSTDNLYALSRLLDTPIDDILIGEVQGDSFYRDGQKCCQTAENAITYYFLNIQAA